MELALDPVVLPPASRNVVVPWLSREAVPVVRPPASRNVVLPWLLGEAVPMVRPRASRNVVCGSALAVVAVNTAAAQISFSIRGVLIVGPPAAAGMGAQTSGRPAGC